MTSLKDLAKQVTSNFDPENDNPNEMENEGLPVGEYDCILKSLQFHVYDSGYECIAIEAQVVGDGEHAGRSEFINVNLDPEYTTKKGQKLYEDYPFMLKNNIKAITQLAYAVDVKLEDDDWDDMVSIARAFEEKEGIGGQFILVVEKEPSKDKTKVYTNYTYAAYAF